MSDTKVTMIGDAAYSSTGGIQAVNRFVISELSNHGLLRNAYFLWDNAEVTRLEGARFIRSGVLKVFNVNRLKYVLGVLSHAIRYRDDLWLCSHINHALLAFIASGFRARRVALFVYAYELDVNFGWWKRWVIRRLSRIIAISKYTAKKAQHRGAPSTAIHVLYLGTEGPPRLGHLSAIPSAPTVLFVGRMDEHYKGQIELLDAMVILRKRFPKLTLTFVGGGKTLDDWHKAAEKRGLSAVVIFAGRVPDNELHALYESATVFAMPSANEGFGLVYVEAMAYGIPCIASNRDAGCEVVVDGETGFCVPAGNPTALADAIAEVVRSSSLRTRMSVAARGRYELMFATEHYRHRLLTLIDDWTLASSKPRRAPM
jgi:phosphatidyl-myo-inositol dimannoside synthase